MRPMSDERLAQYDANRTARQDYTIIHSMEKKQFFFSIDHCQGVIEGGVPDEYREAHWVPISFGLPYSVVPRPEFPDGWIDTIEKEIALQYPGEEEIPNPNPRYIPAFRKEKFNGS